MSWIGAGALLCAASVAGGAFGAHGLEERLDAESLVLWEIAARYLMYSGLALAVFGIAARVTDRSFEGASWALLAGAVVFSGTVAVLALGGPRWLGAVTPFGGLSMIVGLIWFAARVWRP